MGLDEFDSEGLMIDDSNESPRLCRVTRSADRVLSAGALLCLRLPRPRSLLQEQGASGSQSSMLNDLGAYLTLDRAEKQYGFSAKQYGLTDEQAGQVAVAFAQFDLNDDGVLSIDEFRKLWWVEAAVPVPEPPCSRCGTH